MVKYTDRTEEILIYEILVDILYSNIDEDKNKLHIFYGIVGHLNRKVAVDKTEILYKKNFRRFKKLTTSGWGLEVDWKNATISWIYLKDLNKDNQLGGACYIVDNNFMDKT